MERNYAVAPSLSHAHDITFHPKRAFKSGISAMSAFGKPVDAPHHFAGCKANGVFKNRRRIADVQGKANLSSGIPVAIGRTFSCATQFASNFD